MIDGGEERPRCFIRSHPFLSTWIVLTLIPLVAGGALLVVRYMPACSEWRQEVRESAQDAMGARYLGNRRSADIAYQSEGSGYADIMKSLLKSAERERAESRPFACI